MIRSKLNRAGLIVLLLVSAYAIVNLVDTEPPQNAWRYGDLAPASFDADNGYYGLMSLCMPADRDVRAAGVIDMIRDTADPARVSGLSEAAYRQRITPYLDAVQNCAGMKEMDPAGLLTPQQESGDAQTDQIGYYRSHAREIREMGDRYRFLLDRYRAMIAFESVVDFSWPSLHVPFPSLTGALSASRLLTATALLDAGEGHWEIAVDALLHQVRFCMKLIPGSRLIIVNAVGKTILESSLRALVQIMNHPQAPPGIYPRIFAALPEITAPDIGFRNACIFEYLMNAGVIDALRFSDLQQVQVLESGFADELRERAGMLAMGILLQKNRTKGYLHDFYILITAYEFIPPHNWQTDPDDVYMRRAVGLFWWLRNPVGKLLTDISAPSMSDLIHRTYRTLAVYELTRVIAQFHTTDTGTLPPEKAIKTLSAYHTLDPYSGELYRFDAEKRLLYSVGRNGVDDGGVEKENKLDGDIVLPCPPGNR